MALLALVFPAFADTPQSGTDSGATLTVTPSTGLSDGQVVTVTGTGFPPNTVGTISECGGTLAASQCDVTTTTPFVTTAAGAIPPTAFATKRIVNAGATTFNCAVQTCALVATAGAKSAQREIRMAGAGTVVPTSSTTTSAPTSSTTTSILPTTTTASSTTTTSSSSTSTSMAPTTTVSTTSTAPPTTVAPTSCAALRASQRQASAAIDALVAAYPQYQGVGAQARQGTNARFEQALAAAGC